MISWQEHGHHKTPVVCGRDRVGTGLMWINLNSDPEFNPLMFEKIFYHCL